MRRDMYLMGPIKVIVNLPGKFVKQFGLKTRFNLDWYYIGERHIKCLKDINHLCMSYYHHLLCFSSLNKCLLTW